MLLISILPHLLLPIAYCFGWFIQFHETLGTSGLWLGMVSFFMVNRFILSPILNSTISMSAADSVKRSRKSKRGN